MAKQFYPEVTDPVRKLELLRNNCDREDETTYLRELTQHELDLKREQLSEDSIKKYRLEEELKAIRDRYNEQIKPLATRVRELLGQVEMRKEVVTGKLFDFFDQENGICETFDERGEFVSSRRLKPEEKQITILQQVRKIAEE